jgi:hypothetical protein
LVAACTETSAHGRTRGRRSASPTSCRSRPARRVDGRRRRSPNVLHVEGQ